VLTRFWSSRAAENSSLLGRRHVQRREGRRHPAAILDEGQIALFAVYGPAGCASCGAHSVRVDPQGNIWAIDATGYVIYKMNPDGKEIMRLGTKGVSGTGPTTFNLPTDVAFAANATFTSPTATPAPEW